MPTPTTDTGTAPRHRPAWIRIARGTQRGQSVIEFALALPVMLLVTLGAVDVGRVFFDYIGLRTAAMEGALYGSRFPTATNDIKQRVRDHYLPNAFPANAAIVAAADGVCSGANSLNQTGFVTVTVTRPFTPLSLSLLGFLAPGGSWTFTVNPTAKARCMT